MSVLDSRGAAHWEIEVVIVQQRARPGAQGLDVQWRRSTFGAWGMG